jgi:hypothetical protein
LRLETGRGKKMSGAFKSYQDLEVWQKADASLKSLASSLKERSDGLA